MHGVAARGVREHGVAVGDAWFGFGFGFGLRLRLGLRLGLGFGLPAGSTSSIASGGRCTLSSSVWPPVTPRGTTRRTWCG